MQTLTEKVFRLQPPGGVFDETVVKNLFPNSSDGSRKAMVHRAVSQGEVLRLKPGLFCLSQEYRHTHPHPFTVAGILLYPSHISLESALWHHGLIPESVHMVTSITTNRSRRFTNPLGDFIYTCVPSQYPRAGVEAVEVSRNMWAFIATPLRALADLIYTSSNVTWKRDGLSFLTESMRIDEEDLQNIDWYGLLDILKAITNKRTQNYLFKLRERMDQ